MQARHARTRGMLHIKSALWYTLRAMSDADQCADAHKFPDNLHCPGCGYNLHHTPGEQCPECGYSLVNMRSDVCRIPWEHRRELGRLRAFWQTVWMVTFRKQRFCEEYAHAVSYTDARKFQWVTLMHVYAVVLAGTGYVYLTVPSLPEEAIQPYWTPTGVPLTHPTLLGQAYAEVWPVVILLACFLLYLFAITDSPSYFLRARGLTALQQNTAIAMSYYTCAPLAAVPALVGVVWANVVIDGLDAYPLSTYVWLRQVSVLIAAISLCIIPLLWWLNAPNLARDIMPQVKGRAVLIATLLPCLFALLAGLILVALPLVILSIIVVFASLL